MQILCKLLGIERVFETISNYLLYVLDLNHKLVICYLSFIPSFYFAYAKISLNRAPSSLLSVLTVPRQRLFCLLACNTVVAI